jgi:hypothetical protein
MYTYYVRQSVLRCGHCIVGNNTCHSAQQILQVRISTDEPFNVIAMDIWYPWITHRDSEYSKIKVTQGKNKTTLTSICTTTRFATTAFLPEVNSEVVTQHFFAHLFVPNEMPKLILIDKGSEFKGVLIRFYKK